MKKPFTTIKAVVTVFFLLSVSLAFAQTASQKQQITSRYNISKLSQLKTEFLKKAEQKKAAAYRMANQKGWDVIIKNADGSEDHLMAVSSDGKPIYYTVDNVDAARSTRADHLNSGGSLGLNLNGDNLTAHVWDGGPTRPTHQEFDGAGGNNRVTINDGNTTLDGNSFHAQHVTGTIVASGVVAAAKGMAHHANALTHDWNNDLSEATTEAANGMLISNHSYGYRADLIPDWYFGAYMEESRDWDALMYNSPNYLMVVAAGNDGSDNSSNGNPLNGQSAYDKLSGHATSKNNMVVANGQDANVNNDGSFNSVVINSSSSEGPTDDLRIKPDITGNGTGVYSTYEDYDSHYASISGTSMASPNVTGTLLLLQEHYNNVNSSFMRASTLKGLALHTADDAGSAGPDVIYGWGLLNAKVAAEAITQNGNQSKIEEVTLSNGGSYTINVDSDGTNPLIASISWTDPAGTANTGTANLTTPVLVNDLDIRVTKGGSTYNPYKLTSVSSNTTGDNNVDPYERVDVSGATGSYTITVTHKGSLSGGSQTFSLVVTGLTGTPVVCNASTPTGLNSSSVDHNSANISWNQVAGATYDLRYRVSGTSSWTTNAVSGTSSSLSGLSASTTYQVQVRSKCDDGSNSSYSSSHTFTTADQPVCANTGDITLTLTTDNYASETSWTLTDGSGSTVASSGSLANNTTYNETFSNLDGEGYTFTINDSYGDGICCSYGNGSYTLTSQNGNTIASGGSFGSTEATTFCVAQTGGGGDTEAPTTPGNLSASNVTTSSFDLSWTASSDNVGVDHYDVTVGGSTTSVSGTSYSATGLSAGTTYNVSVVAVDAAGNTSSAATVTVTTDTSSGGGSTTLVNSSFETGWDGWSDGGSDCYRYSGSRSYGGSYSIRIRDNSGTASSMTSGSHNVSVYNNIAIEFYFYAYSMENGEDFWVQYYDGSSWNTVASYARGTNFDNNTFYTATVNVSSSSYNFPSNAQFRFRCDASGNNDHIYIDDVTITASSGTSSIMSTGNSVTKLDRLVPNENLFESEFDQEALNAYPNPFNNTLTVESNGGKLEVYNMMGQLMMTKNVEAGKVQLDVASLKQGIYIIRIGDEVMKVMK